MAPLSPRQRQVLALVADGHTNREAAAALGISAQTIRNHVATILVKTGARSRAHAVAMAIRSGVIE